MYESKRVQHLLLRPTNFHNCTFNVINFTNPFRSEPMTLVRINTMKNSALTQPYYIDRNKFLNSIIGDTKVLDNLG